MFGRWLTIWSKQQSTTECTNTKKRGKCGERNNGIVGENNTDKLNQQYANPPVDLNVRNGEMNANNMLHPNGKFNENTNHFV